MGIKKRLQRKIVIQWYELSLIIIVVLFSTLLLITAWPRFRSDVMSIEWYWYLIFTIIFLIPLYKKHIFK